MSPKHSLSRSLWYPYSKRKLTLLEAIHATNFGIPDTTYFFLESTKAKLHL